MEVVFFVGFGVVACFSAVLIFGAPYLPTHKKQIELSIDLLDMKQGGCMYELGCGDGRVLKAAARKGYTAIGYELNPIMYLIALINTRKYRAEVEVKFANFWRADLKNADGVYVFLLDKFMDKLDTKLENELKSGVKLASYTFKIPNKKPSKIESGFFVYTY